MWISTNVGENIGKGYALTNLFFAAEWSVMRLRCFYICDMINRKSVSGMRKRVSLRKSCKLVQGIGFWLMFVGINNILNHIY